MKIAIIGAGNIGGAIARGLINGGIIEAKDLTISNPSSAKLMALKDFNAEINTTCDNKEAIKGSDLVILAVKPWMIEKVLLEITLKKQQILISVAAGITFGQLGKYSDTELTMYRVIPNTAISQRCSMTLISSHNSTHEQDEMILSFFNQFGISMIIPEEKMNAGTSLASCGIAYVLKYIQAGMQAGIELGFKPEEAKTMIAQSVKGAAELILNNDSHPSIEIDKVTTPGGLTIKGINELEHNGFSSAIIKAMKASTTK
jgi:pyrroline-5-carboxylate reductase